MRFQRTIGIDYSGAETADAGLKGLRVAMTEAGGLTRAVAPPPGPKKYWTRRALAEWLQARLAEPVPKIAGLDHGFSFPEAYFARHRLARDWDVFLDDFHAHWPTDQPHLYVDFLRDRPDSMASARGGDRRWRRRVEEVCKAKSVFHFDVQGQVAKSTHAGLPFLRLLRRALPQLHVWPFDGWQIAPGQSVLCEAYPRLYSAEYPAEDRTPDQHDAHAIASWLRDADRDGRLAAALAPHLLPETERLACHEGWILGVLTDAAPKPKSPPRKAKPPATGPDWARPGFRTPWGQVVIAALGPREAPPEAQNWHICCGACGLNYTTKGADVPTHKCPACGNGPPGLVI